MEAGRLYGPALGFPTMRHVAGALLCACLLALPSSLSAQQRSASRLPAQARFSASERDALGGGRMVSRPLRFDQQGGSYVGGVSYQVVDARPEMVLAALSDVANW